MICKIVFLAGCSRRVCGSCACISCRVHDAQHQLSLHACTSTATDDKWLYTVALPKQIVRVFEHILAAEYREGEAVLLRGEDGCAPAPVTVVAADASHWSVCCLPQASDSRTFTLMQRQDVCICM